MGGVQPAGAEGAVKVVGRLMGNEFDGPGGGAEEASAEEGRKRMLFKVSIIWRGVVLALKKMWVAPAWAASWAMLPR